MPVNIRQTCVCVQCELLDGRLHWLVTATSSNGHIETLGYIVNQSQCNLQLCYVAVRREVSACHRYIHTYKGTYIYFMVWSRCKYGIVANMTLYHQILQMIAYRLFYVGRVSSHCGEYVNLYAYKFSKSSHFFNRAIVTDCNDLSGILRFKIFWIEIDGAILL